MKGKSDAVTEIREATERFVAECASATENQWLLRPTPTAWSMSHVAEHVALANDSLYRTLTKRLLGSPMRGRTVDVRDAEIPYLFYRGDEPPSVATPSGDWTDREPALESVTKSSTAILEWARDVPADLREFGVAHPVFGVLDGIQWLLFVAAHTERHRAQLIGLKSLAKS